MEWLDPKFIGIVAAAIASIVTAVRGLTRAKVAEAASRQAMEYVPEEAQILVIRKALEESRQKFEKAERWAPRLGWNPPLPDNFKRKDKE